MASCIQCHRHPVLRCLRDNNQCLAGTQLEQNLTITPVLAPRRLCQIPVDQDAANASHNKWGSYSESALSCMLGTSRICDETLSLCLLATEPGWLWKTELVPPSPQEEAFGDTIRVCLTAGHMFALLGCCCHNPGMVQIARGGTQRLLR